MFKKILVPIDSGKAADMALSKAIDLCQIHHAKLRIVHAIDYIELSVGSEGIDTKTLHEGLKDAAQKLLIKAQKKSAKRKVKAEIILIESYNLSDRIDKLVLKSVKSWRPDLVVIGMEKKEGLKKLFFGSHSEKLIDAISAPILLIKSKSSAKRTG